MNQVGVGTEFEGVAAFRPGEVVCDLEAALDAVLSREGLAAKEGKSSDVDGGVAAAGKIGEAVVEAPARELETKFIEEIILERSGVLENGVEIARLLVRRTVARVLTEVLVLRVHLDAGGGRRRNVDAKEGRIGAAPDVVELQRPQARLLLGRIVSQQRNQALKTGGEAARSAWRRAAALLGKAVQSEGKC